MIRKAAVAGTFYPGSKEALEKEIDSFLPSVGEKSDNALGLIVPHAGYRYSGAVAAKTFSQAKIANRVILFGPNHYGEGSEGYAPKAALFNEGVWQSPLGDIEIDGELSNILLEETDLLTIDLVAHYKEHSLEVQIPFVKKLTSKDVAIVPILLSHMTASECVELGAAVARAISRLRRKVTLIASTDFSHYVAHEKAVSQDRMAIDKIIGMDGPGLMETVRDEKISMCGYNPVAVVIEACKLMGNASAKLVEYKTSGDASGDYSSVVGYAGLIIDVDS